MNKNSFLLFTFFLFASMLHGAEELTARTKNSIKETNIAQKKYSKPYKKTPLDAVILESVSEKCVENKDIKDYLAIFIFGDRDMILQTIYCKIKNRDAIGFMRSYSTFKFLYPQVDMTTYRHNKEREGNTLLHAATAPKATRDYTKDQIRYQSKCQKFILKYLMRRDFNESSMQQKNNHGYTPADYLYIDRAIEGQKYK